MANFFKNPIKAIQQTWDDITGKTATDRQKEALQQGGAAMAGNYENYAKAMEQAYAQMMPYMQGGYDQAQQSLAQQMGLYGGAQNQAIAALLAGQNQAIGAAQQSSGKQEALVREGMAMDQGTLQQFLQQALAAQAPYASAYGSMLSTALPQLLQQFQGGYAPGQMSDAARLQMEDTSRRQRAALQRQGLEGSGMASAQDAAARRRIMAEDEQRQYQRWQDQYARSLGLVNQGLSGQNLTSGLLGQYASQMGQLGNRLGGVKVADLTNLYGQTGRDIAEVYGGTASKQAQAMQQANLPGKYQSLGEFIGQKTMNPAQARLQGALGQTQANTQAGTVQGPTFLQSLGQIASIGSSLAGMFGGGGTTGYFGSPGSWSSQDYSYGYRGVGPLNR